MPANAALRPQPRRAGARRVETVINQPDEFKIRRRVRGQGRHVTAWVPMRKGVAFLPRYRQICAQTNARYLDALAHVDDPTPAIRALDALTARASSPNGRTVRPFNPLSRHDRVLCEPLLSGAHALHGFGNRDLRHKLGLTSIPLASDPLKQSAQVTRLLRRLPRPPLDRQDSTLATLARFALRPSRHGRGHQATGSRLRQSLRRCCLTSTGSSQNAKKLRRKNLYSAKIKGAGVDLRPG